MAKQKNLVKVAQLSTKDLIQKLPSATGGQKVKIINELTKRGVSFER